MKDTKLEEVKRRVSSFTNDGQLIADYEQCGEGPEDVCPTGIINLLLKVYDPEESPIAEVATCTEPEDAQTIVDLVGDVEWLIAEIERLHSEKQRLIEILSGSIDGPRTTSIYRRHIGQALNILGVRTVHGVWGVEIEKAK